MFYLHNLIMVINLNEKLTAKQMNQLGKDLIELGQSILDKNNTNLYHYQGNRKVTLNCESFQTVLPKKMFKNAGVLPGDNLQFNFFGGINRNIILITLYNNKEVVNNETK